MEYILAFGSTHKALKAELALRGSGVPFRLMPAPKVLAEYCALVISVAAEDLTRATGILESAGSPAKAVYGKEGDEYVKV